MAQKQRSPKLTTQVVEYIGMLVEPQENKKGFRRGPVFIGGQPAPHAREIEGLMARWEENIDDMTPDQAYLGFEHIHPFNDGNGRTGKIILNWKSGTLNNPFDTDVPNPWGILNP